MSRILAIDYGSKRSGIAVSDPLKIIANPLTTVQTNELLDFLKDYTNKEDVDTIIIGMPKKVTGEDSETMKLIRPFVEKLRKIFPDKRVELVDERFTTKIAFQAMIDAGLKKSSRNNKNGIVDKLSATIILQTFMQ